MISLKIVMHNTVSGLELAIKKFPIIFHRLQKISPKIQSTFILFFSWRHFYLQTIFQKVHPVAERVSLSLQVMLLFRGLFLTKLYSFNFALIIICYVCLRLYLNHFRRKHFELLFESANFYEDYYRTKFFRFVNPCHFNLDLCVFTYKYYLFINILTILSCLLYSVFIFFWILIFCMKIIFILSLKVHKLHIDLYLWATFSKFYGPR